MPKLILFFLAFFVGLSSIAEAGRMYDPEIARFTTPDPALYENAPNDLFDISDGRLLMESPYSYGHNNPLRYVDPDGKTPIDVFFAALSIADAIKDPTPANIGWAVADVVAAAIPVVPSTRYVRAGVKAADKATDVARGADRATDVAQGADRSTDAAQGVRNSHLSGGVHPKTGVPFDSNGFPDFTANLYKGGTNNVSITPTGNRAADVVEANRAAGYRSTPEGYTWHHHQETGRMQLVQSDVHRQTGHTGGFSLWQR